MSQNPKSEFQIPTNDYNSDSQASIYDELKTIYQDLGEDGKTEAYVQSQPEKMASPISERLFFIADEIASARAKELSSQSSKHTRNRRIFIFDVAEHLFSRELPSKYFKPLTENDLRSQESEIGAKIFGQTAANTRRGFWNDDRQNWYFHEETTDPSGKINGTTLHYEIGPTSILRISSNVNVPNEFISGQELDNFVSAAETYRNSVIVHLYSNNINSTDKKLAA